MLISLLSIALFIQVVVCTENDWGTPCFGGSCRYSTLASGTNNLWTSLVINGSSHAISDITSAAGWTILGCDQVSLSQDIRLVCTGNSQDCDHINLNGAAGTIVRLPENCGPMPFARVAKKWVHQNQTLPSSILAKDGAVNYTVHGLSLDTNFRDVDPSQNGNITLYVVGSSISNAHGNFSLVPSSTEDLQARGLGSLIADALQGLAFNATISNALPPISITKSFTPFDQSITCSTSDGKNSFTGEVRVDVVANATAQINYGLAAVGTLIPPQLTDFGLFASLYASLDGNLRVSSTASASIETGTITIFQQGIPSLDIPGILTIGPVLKVNVVANGTASANVNLDVDLSYKVNNAQLYFPSRHGTSSGGFAPADTNLQLAVAPNVTLLGSVEGHVIPTLEFGITALGGIAQATIDLDLDTSATLDLTLQTPKSGSANSLSGCVDVHGGFAVNAGADANFFGLFSAGDSITLFSENFELFKICTGTPTARSMVRRGISHKDSLRIHSREFAGIKRAGLTCPSSLVQLVSIVDQSLQGTSIKAI